MLHPTHPALRAVGGGAAVPLCPNFTDSQRSNKFVIGAALLRRPNQSHQAMEPMAAATSQMSSTARVRLIPMRTSRCDR